MMSFPAQWPSAGASALGLGTKGLDLGGGVSHTQVCDTQWDFNL